MTKRPVYFPCVDRVGVVEEAYAFKWSAGFALKQKQKNVSALHQSVREARPNERPLEISTKSCVGLGAALSAMNLGVQTASGFCSVESVFQASKVFSDGTGPFPELYSQEPRRVRKTIRGDRETGPVNRGELVAFDYAGERWPLTPLRAFYDWIYCRALQANRSLVKELEAYTCFTDIEFNPAKSINCQAHAVALYLSLAARGVLEGALSSREEFIAHHPDAVHGTVQQLSLFDAAALSAS